MQTKQLQMINGRNLYGSGNDLILKKKKYISFFKFTSPLSWIKLLQPGGGHSCTQLENIFLKKITRYIDAY